MNIDTRNFSENTQEKENTPLMQEDFFQFESKQEKICEIRQEWDSETLFSQIESYNMIQEFTLWKVEYCSRDGIEYIVKSWDSLTKICQEYYGDMQVAYDIMEMYWVSDSLWIWQKLFLPKQIWEYRLKEKGNAVSSQTEIQDSYREENNTQTLNKIDNLISQFNEIDSQYNFFLWMLDEDGNFASIKSLKDKREFLYQGLLKEENEWIVPEWSEIRKYVEYYFQDSKVWDFFQIDYDEEILLLLAKTKRWIIEKSQISEEAFEKIEYKELQERIKILQNETQQLKIQIKDYPSQEQIIEKKYLDAKLRYLEELKNDYIKDIYVEWLWIDRSTLRSQIELSDMNYDKSLWWFILFAWDNINKLRWYSLNKARLYWELIKIENKRMFYNPSSDLQWYVENWIQSLRWNKYFDMRLSYQLVNAIITWVLDLVVDMSVAVSTVVLRPELVAKDIKNLSAIVDNILQSLSLELFKDIKNYYVKDTYNAIPSTFYMSAYFYSMIKIPASNIIPMPPNLVSYSTKLSAWVTWHWLKLWEILSLRRRGFILEKNHSEVWKMLKKLRKEEPDTFKKLDDFHKKWEIDYEKIDRLWKVHKESNDIFRELPEFPHFILKTKSEWEQYFLKEFKLNKLRVEEDKIVNFYWKSSNAWSKLDEFTQDTNNISLHFLSLLRKEVQKKPNQPTWDLIFSHQFTTWKMMSYMGEKKKLNIANSNILRDINKLRYDTKVMSDKTSVILETLISRNADIHTTYNKSKENY